MYYASYSTKPELLLANRNARIRVKEETLPHNVCRTYYTFATVNTETLRRASCYYWQMEKLQL